MASGQDYTLWLRRGKKGSRKGKSTARHSELAGWSSSSSDDSCRLAWLLQVTFLPSFKRSLRSSRILDRCVMFAVKAKVKVEGGSSTALSSNTCAHFLCRRLWPLSAEKALQSWKNDLAAESTAWELALDYFPNLVFRNSHTNHFALMH